MWNLRLLSAKIRIILRFSAIRTVNNSFDFPNYDSLRILDIAFIPGNLLDEERIYKFQFHWLTWESLVFQRFGLSNR